MAQESERTVAADYSKDFETLEKMEWAFSRKDVDHFRSVLDDRPSLFIRVHAVCMLADLKDERAVPPLARVLRDDSSPLIRHEAAFVLAQLGFKSAVVSLIEAMEKDESVLVRHESAVALGSIGDERARISLEKAVGDSDEDVRYSAEIALADLAFLSYLRSKVQKSS
ncbi:MAG TPA: HEAT repeat domain-containing protein [Candidatus Binatus sp.]|nr:HEAT repeat domain-containing protein [Candidatus Binatus sp.]